ncbi:hypothetical protein [Nocardia veterana]|uniref:hypothetical protein n=1 Tax=Nocardia veterana TaxID=132249 RepID=UPI0002F8C01F|nr:hypothetical protein [Nocardia veterana]
MIGWRTDCAETVEIPHLLTGFLEPRTYLGSPLTDTGRGTFRLTGTPVADGEALSQMTMEPDETCIEVPKNERTYFGGTPADD